MPFVALSMHLGDGHGSWWWEAAEVLLITSTTAVAAHKALKLGKHPRVQRVGFASITLVLALAIFAHHLLPAGLLMLLGWQVWSERYCCAR